MQQARPSVEKILQFLHRRERRFYITTVAFILAGLVLAVAGQMLLVLAVMLISDRYWWTEIMYLGYWQLFWRVVPFTAPLALVLALVTRGSLFEAAMESADPSSVTAISSWPQLGCAVALLDVANIGPALMVYTIHRAYVRLRIGRVDLSSAAHGVLELVSAEGGVDPTALFPRGAQQPGLPREVKFLLFHEIADVSKAQDDIWLSSDAKREIARV